MTYHPHSDNEELFRDLFDNAPVGYHELNASGRIARVNKTEASMLGYRPEEMIGHYAWEFVVESISKDAFAAKLAGTLPLAPIERTFRKKDGSHLPVMLEERLLHDEAGRAAGIRTTVFDITARKQAEKALSDSEERYRQLVELSPDAILVHVGGRIVFANGAALKLYGSVSHDSLLGRNIVGLIHPESREVAEEQERNNLVHTPRTPSLEQKVVRLDGTAVDVEVVTMPIVYDGQTAVQMVIRDITLRKLAEDQIRTLAYHDALTGLPNRILFSDRLSMAAAQAVRQKQKVAVLFVDLDRFKAINDSLGHAVGDMVLRAVASRIQSCVRKGDTVGRFGGDEFVLLLPGLIQSTDAARTAEKVLVALRLPFHIQGRELFVTASIGISVLPDDTEDIDGLLRNSDVAMYRTKQQGRDGYQSYSADMQVRASERFTLEGSLPKAFDQHQFAVYYQPVVASTDGSVIDCEALVRWEHPELGLILAQDFLPMAEKVGLIIPIGTWVLRQACAQAMAWKLDGHPDLCVSVNLSTRQLQHVRLVHEVRAALHDSGLSPASLQLEIDENIALDNAELVSQILHELVLLGVRITLDNFGVGNCSVGYLHGLSVHRVKLDGSLVQDIADNDPHAAIVKALLSMSHSLGLEVVATKVENDEQLARVRQCGVDAVQGFLIQPPMSSVACKALLR